MAEAFVDTSFVVALVNHKDQYHAQALELASQFDNRPLITTDAVLLEIGNALTRNFKQPSIQIIEHFLNSEEVEIISLSSQLFAGAFDLYLASRQELGLNRLCFVRRDARLRFDSSAHCG